VVNGFLAYRQGVAAEDVVPFDLPSPCITASGIRKCGHSDIEVVLMAEPYLARRSGFSTERTSSIDAPPCIQAGGIDGSSTDQTEIVMPASYLASSKKKGHSIRTTTGIDDPAPCITTEGLGAERAHYAQIVAASDQAPVDVSGKPPYRRPLLSEVHALGTHGLTHVSTFSGGGGTCLGFKMAGFRTLWANDIDPIAQQTYGFNFPDVDLDRRDIRVITAADILSATGLKAGELDVFEGSPPCTAFSTAGRREDGWNETKMHGGVEQDRIEDLFFEWIRLLDGLQPKVAIAENVVGLTMGVARGIYNGIVRAIKAAGYRVECRKVDAQWLGVPQTRGRVIFVCVRQDLDLPITFPTPLPYRYSIRDACPHLSTVTVDAAGINAKPTAKAKHKPKISSTEPAGAVTTQQQHHGIAVEAGKFAVRRLITIDEVRALCSFPDDFWLPKSRAQAWARMGNSVPPIMAYRLARALAEGTFGKSGPYIAL